MNAKRIIWPKFKLLQQLMKYEQGRENDASQNDKIYQEFEELADFIKNQKWKLSGKVWKT